jgi:hypothetical protein
MIAFDGFFREPENGGKKQKAGMKPAFRNSQLI